tara:strand:- start:202 stop:621 length:420 start_codon:yes stop_codon:yes gene_type:complete
MSAFLVGDPTINHIADMMVYGPVSQYISPILPHLEQKECANRLKILNLESLNQRYGDNWDDVDAEVSDERFDKYPIRIMNNTPAPSLIQSLKHVQCYLYQCNEGNVPDSSLYKDVEKLQNGLIWEIISNMKEYNQATWE